MQTAGLENQLLEAPAVILIHVAAQSFSRGAVIVAWDVLNSSGCA
jgi:hypothetical protein